MVQFSFIQTQLSDSGKRLIVITTVVIIGRKVKDNSAFSTRTRCCKNIAIKMLVHNTANFWQDRYTKLVPGRYTFGKAGTLLATKSVPGRYKFGNLKCTARYNFRPVQFLRDRPHQLLTIFAVVLHSSCYPGYLKFILHDT